MSQNGEPIDEERLDELEKEFPKAAAGAFIDAYNRALQTGLGVVVAEHDQIVRVFLDGRREVLKVIKPSSPAQPGQKFFIP